jgi:hypothetical protein
VERLDPLPGRINYLIGRDREKFTGAEKGRLVSEAAKSSCGARK